MHESPGGKTEKTFFGGEVKTNSSPDKDAIAVGDIPTTHEMKYIFSPTAAVDTV
jgi:hypothetical protein